LRPRDILRARQLDERLAQFHRSVRPVAGVLDGTSRGAFLEQVVESIRRVEFLQATRDHGISQSRQDPNRESFDPLRAAMLYQDAGNLDEAFWLVFLSVHFGKHRRTGWRLTRDIYGALGGTAWTWHRISADPSRFRPWLAANLVRLQTDGVVRRFGNHRKYESLRTDSSRGTASVLESYIAWVNPPRDHLDIFTMAIEENEGSARSAFKALYNSMDSIISFGRTARFDYLSMVSKLGLAEIEPGSTYLDGATGPYRGAKLLFGPPANTASRDSIDEWLVELGDYLGVPMHVLEDALCNWQKSPNEFVRFRG